jgi:hypothetical protein
VEAMYAGLSSTQLKERMASWLAAWANGPPRLHVVVSRRFLPVHGPVAWPCVVSLRLDVAGTLTLVAAGGPWNPGTHARAHGMLES